jgi:hypothetical protein
LKAGLPAWPIVCVETTTSAQHNRDPAVRAFPGLCGVSEVAERAGVTRQRASRLAKRPDFPAPIAELAAGPVWAAPTVERFLDAWRRTPGRPAKEVVDADAAERDGHVKYQAVSDRARRENCHVDELTAAQRELEAATAHRIEVHRRHHGGE